ncbi:MAG: aminopeptidase P family protein [bacterium]|nr:aminopeptidase P family protein [bacterium]
MNKTKKFQEYLTNQKLDAFLVMTRINRQYLSGFTGSAGYLFITPKFARLYVDSRYLLRAKKETEFAVFHLDKLLPQINKLKKIGIEDRISLAEFKSLKKFKGVTWVATTDVVEKLRAEKTASEIKLLDKGSFIIDTTFRSIQKLLKKKKSITEIEIAQLIERFGKSHGAEGLAFDSIVAWGANAAIPHHFSSSQKIGNNNFLLLDFGMKVGDMHSDFTRTLFIGKPSGVQKKIYHTVLEAQERAIGKIEIGQKAANVDKEARDFIESQKYGKYFTHNTGHGVGMEIHELPNFSEKSRDVLQKNMVVTVEPGIYLPKKGGVRIEDMVLVGSESKIFSTIPKDFNDMLIT